jgi:hypothetical protein
MGTLFDGRTHARAGSASAASRRTSTFHTAERLSIQWGNAAEWVGGIATAGAVVFAAISVRQASKSARDAQADRAWDEADLVTTWAMPPNRGAINNGVVYTGNEGRRPIYDVEVQAYRNDDGSPLGEPWHYPQVPQHSSLGKEEIIPEGEEWSHIGPLVWARVTFTDVHSQRWIKTPTVLMRVNG